MASGFGSEQTLSIAAGQQASYTFTAPAGLVFYVDTLANTFDNINVSVKDPNNNFLANGNDGDDKGPYHGGCLGDVHDYTGGVQRFAGGRLSLSGSESDRRRDADGLG